MTQEVMKIKECKNCIHHWPEIKPEEDPCCIAIANGEVIALRLGWLKEDVELCYLNKELNK